MATPEELACVYSSMILQDGNSPMTAENISTLLKTAGVSVESYWPGLFAKALETLNLKDLVSNVGGGAGATVAAPVAGEVVEEKESKKEAKKEEEEEEEEDGDMGFGLFD